MTQPKSKIEASLAERGRPAMWANEQEAAARCGLSPDEYRKNLDDMEAAGFPKKLPMNGLRFIPAIDAFMVCKLDEAMAKVPELPIEDESNLEVFNGKGQRRAS